MSPVETHLLRQLKHLIFYNLDCNLPRNALFLAGRLHAYEPRSPEAAYLVSLCHLRLEQYKSAYDYSKTAGSRGMHLGCSYIFAQSCLALARYPEGIVALERSKGLWAARSSWNKHTETRRQNLPDAAAVYCLQGKLFHAFQEQDKAIQAYVEALKLNPFMWDAFMALSDLGAAIKVENIFRITPEMMNVLSIGSEETPLGSLGNEGLPQGGSHAQPQPQSQTTINDPFSISTNRLNNDNRLHSTKPALFEKLNGSSVLVTPINGSSTGYDTMETPTGPGMTYMNQLGKLKEPSVTVGEVSVAHDVPHAPTRKTRLMTGVDFSTQEPPRMKTSTLRGTRGRLHGDSDDTEAVVSSMASTVSDRKRTASGKTAETSTMSQGNGTAESSAGQRRSARLFSQFTSKPTASNKFSTSGSVATAREGREIKKVKSTTGTKVRSTQSQVGRVVSGNRKHVETADLDAKEHRTATTAAPAAAPREVGTIQAQRSASDKAREQEALQTLLELFVKLGSGYFALSNFRNGEAVSIFNSMSESQFDTPWVLAQMGRAMFEKNSYVEAEGFFARVRGLAPSRIEDMDLYSTTLWHLKRDIDLAHLAHELVSSDRLSPQAWIAVGNSFSLQRDHDQALKSFKRAAQLDPTFAYAFALQGHEHIYNEEFDKAMVAFRNGITADNRHYNAWYGMAKVYEKQGKFDVAEQHYRTAARLNPTSAILLCCIGVVLEKQRKPENALAMYTDSLKLEPKSTLALFKRARVLTSLGQNETALGVLMDLKVLAPDEANVHFLLGRVYRNLRRKGEAIKHFTEAQNLDPKVNSLCRCFSLVLTYINRLPITSKKPWSKWSLMRKKMI
jgi:anaphase-promoting complex subunit 3